MNRLILFAVLYSSLFFTVVVIWPFHHKKPEPSIGLGQVIAVQDPAVLKFCGESMQYIRADMTDRPDLTKDYLLPTAKDVYELGTMSMDDPAYEELLARVKYEMWQIHELDQNGVA